MEGSSRSPLVTPPSSPARSSSSTTPTSSIGHVSLIGYFVGVSKEKISKTSGSKYFNTTLQTEDESYRCTVFDINKHHDITSFSKSNSGVEIVARVSRSPFSGKNEVTIDRRSTIKPIKLDFPFEKPKELFTISEILNDAEINSFVTFHGTVTELSVIKASPDNSIYFREAVVRDSEAAIKCVLWEEALESVKVNVSYKFHNLRVKSADQINRYVNTPNPASNPYLISIIDNLPTLTNEEFNLTKDKTNKIDIVSVIHFLHISRCPHCKKGAVKTNQSAPTAGTCGACKAVMRLKFCKPHYTLKLLAQTSAGEELKLSFSSSSVGQLLNIVFKNQVPKDDEDIKIGLALHDEPFTVIYSDTNLVYSVTE